MKPRLRIIRDVARPAAFNMAADRYLLGLTADSATAFLRLYTWKPPAVSLGCMQKETEFLDNDTMAGQGIERVVRPTGGRAVLHWNDLTYAFVFPANADGFGGSVAASYAVISRSLLRGLEHAGIAARSHVSAAGHPAVKREIKLPCFLSPNRHEIMVQDRKLVGSAQKRTPGAVLQHGSIPIDGSFRRLPEFLCLSKEERSRQRALLEEKCACVQEINPALDYESLSACLAKGITETLLFPASEMPWREEEIDEIRKQNMNTHLPT